MIVRATVPLWVTDRMGLLRRPVRALPARGGGRAEKWQKRAICRHLASKPPRLLPRPAVTRLSASPADRAPGIVTAPLFLTFISPINRELCINPNHMEPHLKKSLVHWDWGCFLLGHTCSCRPKLPHYRAFPTLAERVFSVLGL